MKFESAARQQLACLGDASRYRIVSELAAGRACVTELAGRIGLSQSCTTRHLQALQRAGLVSRERAGKRVLFEVRSQDPAVRLLLDWKTRLDVDGDLGVPDAKPARRSKRPTVELTRRSEGARRKPRPNGADTEAPAAAAGPSASAGTSPAAPGADAAAPPPPERDWAAGALPEESPTWIVGRSTRDDLEDFLL